MYTEIKYLNLLSVRLDKFKKKKEFLWNFRCPICGDSKKNKNKARGFIFQLKGKLLYKCHNCQVSIPFDRFLEKMDPELYREFRMEAFEQGPKRRDMRKVERIVSTKPTFEIDVLSNLTPINELNNHPAREYLLNRQLPLDDLYWTDEFCNYVNSVKPNTFEESDEQEGRIIIPFRTKEGNCFGFQGRAIHHTTLRYVSIILEEHPKIFGLHGLDHEQRIFITEGPFDSLLLQNACAMGGADISCVGDMLGTNVVYVYDNEPRNPQIVSRIEDHIGRGNRVVIWPTHIREKDVNDMVISGLNVQFIVETNTYSGLTATLKLNEWRK